MNDQQFVNEYIRVLNETLSEAFNKNLVMQAQLAVTKKVGDKTAELEAKLQNLTNLSSDNNALQSQIGALTSQLEQTRSSLEQRTSHTETFKRDLVDARNQLKNALDNLEKERLSHNAKVDSLNVEIESLKKEVEELKSKKKKNGKVLNTLENSIYVSNDTFSWLQQYDLKNLAQLEKCHQTLNLSSVNLRSTTQMVSCTIKIIRVLFLKSLVVQQTHLKQSMQMALY